MTDEIASFVGLARDHAILGLYPESISMFEQAILAIDKNKDSDSNWKQIRADLTQECNLVRQINASFQRLRPSGTISTPQQQTTPLSNHGQMATFSLEISNNHYKGPAELGRFRGLPFSHHTSVDPIESIDDSTTSLPIIEAYKGEARHKQKKLAKPLSTPIHIANDQQLAPALLPLRPKRGTVAKKPESLTGNQRIIFLNHRYPEGQGPDTELIQTIERDIIETSPDVSLDSIAGLENAITILHETITLPALMPEFFNGIRRPWKGILLFGPPGTGKTLLAKAVATMGGTTFFNVSSSTLASKWRGESEKIIRLIFEMARFYAPSTVFLDEIDSVVSKRNNSEHEASRRVKTEMLVQTDGVSNNNEDLNKRVIVMAATNRPWDIDEAMIRRLEKRIYIPLPDKQSRKKLFEISLSKVELKNDLDWIFLVKKSAGYSGSDITCVCRDAAMIPLRKEICRLKAKGLPIESLDRSKVEIPLSMDDLKSALTNVNPSVNKKDCQNYEKWMSNFGSV